MSLSLDSFDAKISHIAGFVGYALIFTQGVATQRYKLLA